MATILPEQNKDKNGDDLVVGVNALVGPGGSVYEIPKRENKIIGIFKQPGIYRKLEFLFYRTLCPYLDQTRIGMWWYGVSGRIASYFHKKTCSRCMGR